MKANISTDVKIINYALIANLAKDANVAKDANSLSPCF